MIRISIARPDREIEETIITTPVEISVGRSASCNCCLEFDPLVSRMHAVILITPPTVRIKDLNSTNGLVINGETYGAFSNQKLSQPTEIYDGDVVTIGRTSFTFNIIHDTRPDGSARSGTGTGTGTSPGPRGATGGTRGTSASRSTTGISNPATVEIEPALAGRAEKPSDGNTSITQAPLMTVPGYRLLKLIRNSQSGDLYQAAGLDDLRVVAIKIINSSTLITPKVIEDFHREIENLRRLEHPNLVKIHGAGELTAQSLYVVMEHAGGHDLANILSGLPGQRLALPNAYNLELQLANALCYLHSMGRLHTDLKPSSILIRDDHGRLRVKIMEQGLARFLDETGLLPRPATPNSPVKLGYVAPETLQPLYEAKANADVFSLAAIFYDMLAGRPPYAFRPGTPYRETVEKGLITPLEEFIPDLPEPLAVIVERALSADPENRYQNACAFQEALENAWV